MIPALLALLACGAPDETAVAPVETASTAPVTEDACASVPVVTWDSFGKGFVTGSCQTCHASTSPNLHGAPEDVVFDTEADVLESAALVLEVATGDAPRMPPEGGVSEDDRARLEWWLTCPR